MRITLADGGIVAHSATEKLMSSMSVCEDDPAEYATDFPV